MNGSFVLLNIFMLVIKSAENANKLGFSLNNYNFEKDEFENNKQILMLTIEEIILNLKRYNANLEKIIDLIVKIRECESKNDLTSNKNCFYDDKFYGDKKLQSPPKTALLAEFKCLDIQNQEIKKQINILMPICEKKMNELMSQYHKKNNPKKQISIDF